MQLNLITLATVKEQLGILTATTTYDADITLLIPIVSNDVRRILNCNFDKYLGATVTSGSTSVYIRGINILQMGQVVYSPALPDDTYISSYDPTTDVYTLSTSATAAGLYVYPTITTGMWPAISKMIYYKLTKQTTGSASEELYKSVSYGNVSKTFSDSEVNKKYDYPSRFINELGTPFSVVG